MGWFGKREILKGDDVGVTYQNLLCPTSLVFLVLAGEIADVAPLAGGLSVGSKTFPLNVAVSVPSHTPSGESSNQHEGLVEFTLALRQARQLIFLYRTSAGEDRV